MVKMQRTVQNHQSNVGCSKFFNLNPNAGHENTLQYQHAKIEKIFWFQETNSTANTRRLAAIKRRKNKKVYKKMQARVFLFSMRNLPSAL